MVCGRVVINSCRCVEVKSILGCIRRALGQCRYMDDTLHTHRLTSVPGDAGKCNDVVWSGKGHGKVTGNVVYFSGDIQDYIERMQMSKDYHQYASWDLESTAKLLARRFPDNDVWIIKASRMELDAFNIYSNFVEQNETDSGPRHWAGQNSWRQLSAVLENAVALMNKQSVELQHSLGAVNCDSNQPLTLVGFSKGCVVLNQLLYDLGQAIDENSKFVSNVRCMYWLDGGHNGGSNTWVTADDVLCNLERPETLHIKVFAYATPYQLSDPLRPWIGKEYKQFVDKLLKLNVNLTDRIYFREEPRLLQKHFDVLLTF